MKNILNPTHTDSDIAVASGSEAADRDFVTALARGLEILQCFCQQNRPLGPTEIAQLSELPKSTVIRLIHTLTRLEYLVESPEGGKHRLGPSMLTLNTTPLESLDVREIARPLMQEMAKETGAQVALAVRDRLSILYLETFRGQSLVTLNLTVGSRVPLAVSAGGRAYLAGMSALERADVLERIRSLDEYAWGNTEQGIKAALKEYEDTGCCSSIGDWVPQVNGIAAPIRLGPGFPLMVLSVAGVRELFPAEQMLTEVRSLLLNTVHSIELRCGRRK